MHTDLKIEKLKYAIDQADYIVIGAGSGISTAAGFTYFGKRFHYNFKDFIDKYGFEDMYSAGFYPFDTIEEFWGYWSRYIYINRYTEPENNLYGQLLELVKEKDYFVITTNVDHQFQKHGFKKERLFYMQGDYGLFQCSQPCHEETYDNEHIVMKMVQQQKHRKIPTELVPLCPKCGKVMNYNLRADSTFVQDKGWYIAAKKYEEFINCHMNSKIVYLELGVGGNTPSIIKYPFWRLTSKNTNAIYASINNGEAYTHSDIVSQSICINDDIKKVIENLLL